MHGKRRGKKGWHLTPEILRGLEGGEIDPGAYVTLLMEHIADLCPECGMGLATFTHGAEGDPSGRVENGVEGEDFLDRAVAQATQYHQVEARARERFAELQAMPDHPARVHAVRRGGEAFRNPALVELLLAEGRRRVHDSPEQTRRLAELAVDVARRLPGGPYGQDFCRDRLAEASAHLANALRAQGDLGAAQRLLARVEREIEGSFDLLLRAEVASFAASLARDRRQWSVATAQLDLAERLYGEVGESETIARVRLQRAGLLHLTGDYTQAISLVEDAISVLDESADGALFFIAQHNRAFYLCDAGRFEEASRALAQNSPLYERHRDRSFRLRRRWLEGKIAAGLGCEEEAEAAFREVRDAFLAAGLGYEAAMVAFELAELFLQAGRTAEVREIAAWTTALFEAQDVHREALTAIMLFRQAALRDALTVQELRRTARYLSEVRGNPASRFEAAS